MLEKVTLEEISQSIRKFLFENYLFGFDESELSNDASFMGFGILDSLGIIELIAFIEKEFKIEVAYSEIIPENIDSVNRVSYFVYNKIN